MKTPAINFASALSGTRRARISALDAGLVAIALACTAAAAWQIGIVEVDVRAARTRMEVAGEKVRALNAKSTAKRPQLGRDEANAINNAIRQLNLPWPQIFDALETVTPDSIAILSLAPDAPSETLTMLGEARDTDAMFSYVRALKSQALFDSVAVTRHEVNEKDPHRPVRFEAAAHWSLAR